MTAAQWNQGHVARRRLPQRYSKCRLPCGHRHLLASRRRAVQPDVGDLVCLQAVPTFAPDLTLSNVCHGAAETAAVAARDRAAPVHGIRVPRSLARRALRGARAVRTFAGVAEQLERVPGVTSVGLSSSITRTEKTTATTLRLRTARPRRGRRPAVGRCRGLRPSTPAGKMRVWWPRFSSVRTNGELAGASRCFTAGGSGFRQSSEQ